MSGQSTKHGERSVANQDKQLTNKDEVSVPHQSEHFTNNSAESTAHLSEHCMTNDETSTPLQCEQLACEVETQVTPQCEQLTNNSRALAAHQSEHCVTNDEPSAPHQSEQFTNYVEASTAHQFEHCTTNGETSAPHQSEAYQSLCNGDDWGQVDDTGYCAGSFSFLSMLEESHSVLYNSTTSRESTPSARSGSTYVENLDTSVPSEIIQNAAEGMLMLATLDCGAADKIISPCELPAESNFALFSNEETSEPCPDGSQNGEQRRTCVKSRKKVRDASTWSRSKRRLARQRGQSYIARNGKLVESKQPCLEDVLYNCKRGCSDKVTTSNRELIFKGFYEMDENGKNVYLFKCMKSSVPKVRLCDAKKHRNVTLTYSVNVDSSDVCIV